MNANQIPSAPVNLDKLEEAITTAAGIATRLAADKYHGTSQFAAGIRSAVDHASDLVALQKQWAAANPVAASAT